MKRWQVVAKGLILNREEAIRGCLIASVDPYEEIDTTPARDLGRDIAAAQIVTAAKGDDEWCATLLLQWERLTGRAKEGR